MNVDRILSGIGPCLFLAVMFFSPLASMASVPAQPVSEAAPDATLVVTEAPEEEAAKSDALPATLPPGVHPVDLLNDAQLDQVVEIIRQNFLDANRLSDRELKRARLQGILERLGPGAELVHGPTGEGVEPMPGFLAEILDSRIGYVRLGNLDAAELAQLDAVLEDLKEKHIRALVLDLRNCSPGHDFEMAAEFARRFCPKGRLLFRVQRPNEKQERIHTSNQDPAFKGTLVVLTGERTRRAAEVLAASLRQNAKAMLVGGTTAGKPVETADIPVSPVLTLRVAVAEAVLPELPSLFPSGATPDINISMPSTELDEIFRLSSEKGISSFVFEKDRPRLNEAALIANLNPEIDGSRASSEEPLPKDPVLQRAVDLITAISFFQDGNQ